MSRPRWKTRKERFPQISRVNHPPERPKPPDFVRLFLSVERLLGDNCAKKI